MLCAKVDVVILGQWLQILGEAKQYAAVEELISNLYQERIGVFLDAHQLAVALRSLADAKEIERGRRIFELVTAKNPEFCDEPYVISAMLKLYGANHFEDAKKMFDRAVKAKKACVNDTESHVVIFLIRSMLSC